MSTSELGGADPHAAHPRGRQLLIAIVTLAAAYALLGRLGLSLAHYQINATLVWPATGLALAALIRFGRRLWPGVLAGALAANLWIGTSFAGALGISIGNTIEAVLGAHLLVRVAGFHPGLARLRDVLVFGAFGVVGCTMTSATVGVLSLAATGGLGGTDPIEVWLIWWLGDIGGAALVAPVLLVAVQGRPPWAELARRGETWVVIALVAVTGAAAFVPSPRASWIPLFLSLLLFALLIWAGLRLGPRGAALVGALAGTIAVAGTASGGGPFAFGDPHSRLLTLWAYLTVVGAAASILAAAVAERDDSEAARRRADEERRTIQAQMEHAQRLESLGVLASGIAHDFNNLLTAIRSNTELLRLDLSDASEGVDATLGDIEHASARAGELCRQLLDYAGESVRRPGPLELARLVDDVRRLLGSAMPKGVVFRVDADPDLPRLTGDATQLRQVLMNLILNAVEALAGGEGSRDARGTIDVRLRSEQIDERQLRETFLASDVAGGRFAVIEVEDDGAGMDAQTLERVFDPFFTTKEHGRGLGMAAVVGIVRTHGGAVKVTSEPGRGTTFRVLLPIDPAGAGGEEPP